MKKNPLAFLLVGIVFSSGCVSIHSSSVTERLPVENSVTVRVVEEGDLGVLHLTSPQDLTNRADVSLLGKCPSGRLVNVRTQLSDRDWLGIVQDYKLRVEGECLPAFLKTIPMLQPLKTKSSKPLVGATSTERGLVFTLGSILFDTNKATIKKGSEHSLDSLISYLKSHPHRKIMIEGYTDSTGKESVNRVLSEKRAENVELALLSMGLNRHVIAQIKGYGSRFPVASNKTVRGREKNRRVEIVISDASGSFKKER